MKSLINYTVKEDAVVNYDTDIAGNANDGFKIKNSNNEKVKVPVEKTWVEQTCTKLEHTAGEFFYQLAEVEGVLNHFIFHRAVPFKVKALPPDGFSYTV